MKAVVYEDTRKVGVQDVDDAVIEEPTDVVVRMSSSAICGTDLHMYDGRTGAEAGMVIGHEPLGEVEAVGDDVTLIRKGDRVVIPTHLFCGLCFNCVRGYTAACLRIRPGAFGAAYGMAGQGGEHYRGAQAQLLRVPFADANCVRLPGEPLDDREDDFVLLADAFVTGWHATELANLHPGATVAVFGAGTVGLLAAYSAQLRGAREIYVVDYISERLDKAGEMGAIPINFTEGDPVEQIKDCRRRAGLPIGEEPMDGVAAGIDAVGFQARDREDPERENPTQVVADLARLVNPTGHVAIAGVYADKDHDPAPEGTEDGHLEVPWASFFSKGITLGFGRTHDRRYTVPLRDMITAGGARPAAIVSHHGTLAEAPGFYERFDRRADGVIKAILHPN